ESTELQYRLVDRAAAFGWPKERIEVIDDDLGKSGTSSDGRGGFLLSGKQDEKTYCLTGECSRDSKRCLTKRPPVASPILRQSHSSLS
ncbi:MAG: hypothetical protein WA633_23900, partial [Stellaceae bacterium]